MFKKPFSFYGRIRRTEFGLSYIIYMASIYIIAFIAQAVEIIPIIVIAYIPLIWFLLAQGAKRCHDRGNSGWYQIIPLYALWMLFAESNIGKNEYGPNPKGIGNHDEIDEIGNNPTE